MRYCPNYKCVAYGRVVYSQSTRCVFCRWDLKPPRMKSEASDERIPEVSRPAGPADSNLPVDSQAHVEAHRSRDPGGLRRIA
jgi:hypothetical protein